MYLPLSALLSNQPDWIKSHNPITISIRVLHTCWLAHQFRVLLSAFETEALNVHHMTKILHRTAQSSSQRWLGWKQLHI